MSDFTQRDTDQRIDGYDTLRRSSHLAGRVISALVYGYDNADDVDDLLRVEFTDGTFLTICPTQGGSVMFALRTQGAMG